MKVWKFGLDIGLGKCTLAMPRVREHLSVGVQRGQIVMWAAVDPDHGYEDAEFVIVGTGWDMPDGIYRGTVQIGDFVWHVLEIQEGNRE